MIQTRFEGVAQNQPASPHTLPFIFDQMIVSSHTVTYKKRQKNSIKQKENAAEKAYGLCTEHEKPNELICLSGCKVRVCPHCALFGTHKGHEVREEHEVQAIVAEHSSQLNQMLEEMRLAKGELTDP